MSKERNHGFSDAQYAAAVTRAVRVIMKYVQTSIRAAPAEMQADIAMSICLSLTTTLVANGVSVEKVVFDIRAAAEPLNPHAIRCTSRAH